MQSQLNFQLIQEQKQKLIMTQELRQAIHILQYSAAELVEFMQKEAEENPVVELDFYWRTSSYSQTSEKKASALDFVSESSPSLQEYLIRQLYISSLTRRQRRIGKYMIGLIDPEGYFREDLSLVAREVHCSVQEVEEMLRFIQGLEPIGVGARNLQECLRLQLKQSSIENPLVEMIIDNHLQILAENKFPVLAKQLGVTIQDIQSAANLIKSLQPKPGTPFGADQVRYIVPDVLVEKINDEIVVYTNDEGVPRLQINSYYRELLHGEGDLSEAKEYLQDRLRKAMWVIRSIAQRRLTILKITEAIFKHQRDFLNQGDAGLKPLTLLDIAQEVGVHESTVSRATHQKYVQTPRGVYELKYFFGGGLSTKVGDVTSSQGVKQKIRELIESEDKKKPLSDQQIADFLNRSGIHISRRTIVKYREEMQIPASNKRRIYI